MANTYEIGKKYFEENNLVKAEEYLKKAMEKGDENALGIIEANKGNLEKANEYFEFSAQKGNIFAQCNLAKNYFYGRGIEKNILKARFWAEKAASKNFKPAIELLKKMPSMENFNKNMKYNEKKSFTIIKVLNYNTIEKSQYTIIFDRTCINYGDEFKSRTIKVSGDVTIKDIIYSDYNNVFVDIYGEEFYLKGLLPLKHWKWYIYINTSDKKIATIDEEGNIFLEVKNEKIKNLVKDDMLLEIYANTEDCSIFEKRKQNM